MLLFIFSLLIVSLLSLGQLNHFLEIGGIQPDFGLVFLVTYAFFEKDWLRRSALILLTIFLLNFEPIFNLETLFIITILFVSVALVDYIKWQPVLSGTSIVFIGTVFMNLYTFQPKVVLLETIYNFIYIGIFALLLVFIKTKSQKNV
ncbi:hypothetical protein KKH05_02945 [Patescibacteria group bacterium]|nr:hypothetical protein [Patescibacteria group bacterium]